MDMYSIQQFNTEDEGISDRWEEWSKQLTRILRIKKVTDQSLKIEHLLLCGGQGIERIYNEIKTNNDTYEDLVEKIKAHFNPEINHNVNIFNFRQIKQRDGETFDEFVTRLREQANTCGYDDAAYNREMVHQIILNCSCMKLKEEALGDRNITLPDLIKLGRRKELIKNQLDHLNSNKDINNINRSQQQRQRWPQQQQQ
jgi:hypothetical protein